MADPAAPDQAAPDDSAVLDQAASDVGVPPLTDEAWDEAFDGIEDRALPEAPPTVVPRPTLSIFQQQARCVVGPCRYFFEVAGPRYAQPPGIARYCLESQQRLPGDQDSDGLPVPLRCGSWDPIPADEIKARDDRRSEAEQAARAFESTEAEETT